MKHWKWHRFFMALLVMLLGFTLVSGCDSGKEVVDEVTGNRAVKQYHKSVKDIEKIADKQAERYRSIPDNDKQ